MHSLVYDIMNDHQRKVFEEDLKSIFSFEIPNLARFRVMRLIKAAVWLRCSVPFPVKVLTLE